MSYLNIANSTLLFALAALVIAFVLIQSAVFLRKAWKEGIKIGMEKAVLKKAVRSSGVFSIVPSLPIVISLFAMMPLLGIPLPWIRLSVIGSAPYELIAADSAAKGMGLTGMSDSANATPQVYAAAMWVMTISILAGLILCTFYQRKLQAGIGNIRSKDNRWAEILVGCLFIGLAAAFGGQQLAQGGVTMLTLLTSAAMMMLLGLLRKVKGLSWIENFAMPVSMVFAMGLSILYTAYLA